MRRNEGILGGGGVAMEESLVLGREGEKKGMFGCVRREGGRIEWDLVQSLIECFTVLIL